MSTVVTAVGTRGRVRLQIHEGVFDGACTLLVLIFSAVLFSTPLRHSANLLPYAQDDLYYYLVVARNLAHGVGSTFDGATPTNGYHPLYLLLLWTVAKWSTSLLSTFRFLWLLDVAAAVATFVAARSIFTKALGNRWLSNGFAFVVLWMSCYRFYHQMEVTLVLPLGFCLLLLLDRAPETISVGRWFGIGLVASLLILSRLDAGLLVALCGIAVLLQRDFRQTLNPAKIGAFLSGCLPLLLAYFWVNEHDFGLLLPISGAAKQTKTSHGLSLEALHLSLSHGTEVLFVLSLLALCGAASQWRSLRPSHRLLCFAGLLFPFVHWGVNLLVSDWMLWSWYKYSLTFSIAMLLLLVGLASKHWQPARTGVVAGTVFACSLILLLSSRYRPDAMMVDVADGASFVKHFEETHPGRYAMGDRAGMVAYVLSRPMIQTEGLVMDSAFLNRIRTRQPLLAVLQSFHVDYYVGFQPSDRKNAADDRCFAAREPAQAGASSPVMQATLCNAPAAQFDAPSGRTLIFDLHKNLPLVAVAPASP